jgi:gliding motility-associated-like protein
LTCPANLTLFNNSQNGQDYTWYFGNGDSLQSNNSRITYSYSSPGKYLITLKAINPKTCRLVSFAFDSINIPDPFPFQSLQKEGLYCVGDTLRPSFPELEPYSVVWSPQTYLSNPNSVSPVIIPLSSITYTLTAKNSQGCTNVSTYKSKNRKIDLGFGMEPSFLSCEGTYKVRFFSNKDSSDRYTWFFENGDTASGKEVTRTYNRNGNFPIRLNGAKDNCEENVFDTLRLTDQKVSIVPDFSVDRRYEGCNQPFWKFTNKTVNAQAFIWDFGDGTKSNDTDPEHRYEKPGVYKVKLEGFKDICKEDFAKEIVVDEFKVPNLITLNNDGKNEFFEILGLQPEWKLEIYNRWGKSVYKTNSYKNDWKPERLQEGTYFFNITFPEGSNCNGWVQALNE